MMKQREVMKMKYFSIDQQKRVFNYLKAKYPGKYVSVDVVATHYSASDRDTIKMSIYVSEGILEHTEFETYEDFLEWKERQE